MKLEYFIQEYCFKDVAFINTNLKFILKQPMKDMDKFINNKIENNIYSIDNKEEISKNS